MLQETPGPLASVLHRQGGAYLEAGSRFEGRFRVAGLEVRQFRCGEDGAGA